jgi:hypothetical protein
MLKPNFILHIKTRLFDIYSDSNKIEEVLLFFLDFKIISKEYFSNKKIIKSINKIIYIYIYIYRERERERERERDILNIDIISIFDEL